MPRRDGTQLVRERGRIGAVIDRGGWCHARLVWRGDALERLIVGDPGAWLVVGGDDVPHPLFGSAHPLWVMSGPDVPGEEVRRAAPTTWMGVVRWTAPATLPPILEPGRLPAGAGTMILNVVAMLARDAGLERVRYAGPYPTAALWRSLATCFAVVDDHTEDEFSAGALDRALRGDLRPVPIDFAPAPFARVRVSPRVTVQLRDRLERVTVDGAGYDRRQRVGRLREIEDGGPRRWAAELWLGDGVWGRAAELADDGELRAGPWALPTVADGPLAGLLGQVLPPALCAALADVVAELVAPPLAVAARDELTRARVCWGDPGPAEAIDRDGALVLHAGLWAHLAPHGLGAVARGLALALTAPIAARAQARLAAAMF